LGNYIFISLEYFNITNILLATTLSNRNHNILHFYYKTDIILNASASGSLWHTNQPFHFRPIGFAFFWGQSLSGARFVLLLFWVFLSLFLFQFNFVSSAHAGHNGLGRGKKVKETIPNWCEQQFNATSSNKLWPAGLVAVVAFSQQIDVVWACCRNAFLYKNDFSQIFVFF